jgi:hypothetical protein
MSTLPPVEFTPEEIALIVWARQYKEDGGKMFVCHLDNGNWGVREVGRRCTLLEQPSMLKLLPVYGRITTDGI